MFFLFDLVSVREKFPGLFAVQVLYVAPDLVVSDAAQTLPVYRDTVLHAEQADRGGACAR